MKFLDCTALTIAIIGALNWGLIGIFRFDLVNFLFGNMSLLSRIVYTLVGLSGPCGPGSITRIIQESWTERPRLR